MAEIDPRVRTFRALHESGCFVIPNPWDVGSARMLEQLGFSALATTSAGVAWSLGRVDAGVTVDESLARLEAICAAVRLPVSADFQRGFAIEPDEVAANVTRAIATGVAGLSIEDESHDAEHPLFDRALAVERVAAARRAIDESGTGVVLTARTEGQRLGKPDLAETIARLVAFAEAGADCLFAPGLRELADIKAVIQAVAPKPVNVLVGSGFVTVPELAELGVRRISVGGGLARVALTAFMDAAREIRDQGTFTMLGKVPPFTEVDALFASPSPPRG
jgi:methylisocitrate lyase